MTKYLYGASVQGIQEFIFKTNKLKEIVGASEIVEEICTDFFKSKCTDFKEDNLIIGAAGNIKYVFDNYDACKEMILYFPKMVMDIAPEISISQSMVKFESGGFYDANEQLILNLKVQRNKIPMPYEIGWMGLERARRTGGVACTYDNDKLPIDEATNSKQNSISTKLYEKLTGENMTNDESTKNIEDITKGHINKWIAVIHADGNGLGILVNRLSEKLHEQSKSDDEKIKQFRKFSYNLDLATKQAVQNAFKKVVKEKIKEKLPIRPIVIGGDDITLVIRGDLAMEFTRTFIEEFEKKCIEHLAFLEPFIGDQYKLTMCAGIAYIKESYPFHYGVSLADKLCQEAKKFSKSKEIFNAAIPPSSISFYKVKDSSIEHDLETIRLRTQETPNGVDFNFGPYLINKLEGKKGNYPANLIDTNEYLKILKQEASKKDKSKAVAKLRQLVSESYKSDETAQFMLSRMKEVNWDFCKALSIDKLDKIEGKSNLYELIQLHTLKY